jgi:hypothetical protein
LNIYTIYKNNSLRLFSECLASAKGGWRHTGSPVMPVLCECQGEASTPV